MADIPHPSYRIPLIAWSGGVDSTFLADRYARKGEVFETVYCNAGQAAVKIEFEEIARKQIIEYWEKNRPHYRRHTDRKPYSVTRLASSENFAFSQPLGWLIGLMEVVDPQRHSQVEISYIAGDQIMYHVHEMVKAWEYMWRFTKHGDVVPLVFPLRYMGKTDILKEMDPDLYRLTWVCEKPRLDGPCGACASCKARAIYTDTMRVHHGLPNFPEDIWREMDTEVLKQMSQKPEVPELETIEIQELEC